MKLLPATVLTGFTLLAAACTACALSTGQVDTFEDGTTQNWQINLLGIGSPPTDALPVNVPSGGPRGEDDAFLRLTAIGGQAAGSRLTVINFAAQWAGDYLAAGFKGISMDVNNLGTSDLYLRLEFSDPVGGPPTNLAISQDPVLVPAGSGWTSVLFPITPSDLLPLLGDVEIALRTTTELRIFHSSEPTFPGPPIVAQLGIDNIRPVPEAGSTSAFLSAAFLSLGLFKRKLES